MPTPIADPERLFEFWCDLWTLNPYDRCDFRCVYPALTPPATDGTPYLMRWLPADDRSLPTT